MKCELCKKEFSECKNPNLSFGQHITKTHKIDKKVYYDKHLKKNENDGKCKVCGKETKFISMFEGYLIYCSSKCCNSHKNKIEKTKSVSQAKYGGNAPACSKVVQDKMKSSCKAKFGVENYSNSVEYQNRRKEIRKKQEETCQEKYGSNNVMQNKEVKNRLRVTVLLKQLPEIQSLMNILNLELISEYTSYDKKIKIKCKKCNSEFESWVSNLRQGCSRCPTCFPRLNGISSQEKEVLEFVKSLGSLGILENNKTILEYQEDKRKSKELDIYIPSLKIAIEYNGLYSHREDWIPDFNYHLNKTIECEKQGIRLIHIFEDEWELKKDIVKSRLKQILNKNDSISLYARKCQIKEISSKEKDEFLEKFHIQGKDTSKVRLGAFYDNKLVSVMTFSHGSISKGFRNKDNSVWELNRFCTKSIYHISGIAGKLLSYFKKNYEWKEIFSYADRRWSQGDLYYKLGFKLDRTTHPNYWYIKGMNRIHRFNLRKRPDEPKELTERELRIQEGYTRIWDCGNLKFKLTNNS